MYRKTIHAKNQSFIYLESNIQVDYFNFEASGVGHALNLLVEIFSRELVCHRICDVQSDVEAKVRDILQEIWSKKARHCLVDFIYLFFN